MLIMITGFVFGCTDSEQKVNQPEQVIPTESAQQETGESEQVIPTEPTPQEIMDDVSATLTEYEFEHSIRYDEGIFHITIYDDIGRWSTYDKKSFTNSITIFCHAARGNPDESTWVYIYDQGGMKISFGKWWPKYYSDVEIELY